MTNSENLRAAMQGRPGDYVPLWELEFHCWDQASGKHVVLGREFEKLSPAGQEKALQSNAEIIVSVSRELGFSMLTIPGYYWEIAPGEPAYYWLPKDAVLRQGSLIRKLAGDELALIASSGGVMGMPGATRYLEFSYKLFDAPQEIDEMASRELARGIENAKRYRDAGMDAVFTASDIASNHGPFFNPEQMERYILPPLRQWSAEVRKMGMYAVLHTDGNIMPCLDGLLNSGLNAIQAIDPVAGMDIVKVKQLAAGKLCLCGNVDCGLLQNGPGPKVYDSTRTLLDACKSGGGLILGASNAVFQETPIEHYRQMVRAWRDHGRFGA